jgi:hypothetical protein
MRAVHGDGSWRFLGAYAAAVAMKIYPAFLLPWLWMKSRATRSRLATALVLVVGGVSLPYLATAPRAYISDILFYNLNRTPSNLSWQIALLDQLVLPPQTLWIVGALFLAIFAAVLCRLTALDASSAALVGILAFLLLSKLVIEQYLVWTFPFLIQNATDGHSRSDAALLTMFSAVGMLSNHHVHPFGERAIWLNMALAGSTLAYLALKASLAERHAVAA